MPSCRSSSARNDPVAFLSLSARITRITFGDAPGSLTSRNTTATPSTVEPIRKGTAEYATGNIEPSFRVKDSPASRRR